MRIVQLANFWTPTSGGLRVVMDHLAAGYRERGHRVLQVVPGGTDDHEITTWGRRTTVASPLVPRSGGYRVIVRLRHVDRLVRAFGAEVVEVSDRATLAHLTARWSDRPIRVVLVAHERLDHILGAGAYGRALERRVVRRVADRWNPHCWRGADAIVVPSRYAADEWHRIGIVPRVVPWGVDLDTFRPSGDREVPTGLHLCWVGRLSPEKRPRSAIDALRALRERDASATLTMIGDGPLADDLRRAARGLDVRFVGHIGDPAGVATHLAASSVSLSTSGIETFGLGVLESLACGTPVIAAGGGAVPALLDGCGVAVADRPDAIADAVADIAASPERRRTARAVAEQYPWSRAVDRMLGVLASTGQRAA